MQSVHVLIVGDGYALTPQVLQGISFAGSPDVTDDFFTVSEFLYLLRSNPDVPVVVDTANRRADPAAGLHGFVFTTAALAAYHVLWLFGYEGWNGADYGSPISDAERQAIAGFMTSGGGVYATGDHAGMGSYMCGRLPRVRSMRKWFAKPTGFPPDAPSTALNYRGSTVTAANWPGIASDGMHRADTLQRNPSDTATAFQFDNQSDDIPQTLTILGAPHAILTGRNGQAITRFPDHMHEGEAVTPVDLTAVMTINGQTFVEYPPMRSGARPAPMVIAAGNIVGGHTTIVEGSQCEQTNFGPDTTPTVADTIGTLSVYDGRSAGVGRVVTDSSFHHCLDLNLVGDPCGASADRKAGFGLRSQAPQPGSVLADMQRFYANTVNYLAGRDGNRRGHSLSLAAYWGNDASQHVVTIGTDTHAHELYIHPGAGWANNDLTTMSGLGAARPAVDSAMHGYWGTDNSQHINYVGMDGHVRELYIHPGAGWANNDLTAMSGNGVAAAAGSAIAGYWGSDNSQHVFFVGSDGHLHEHTIHPGAGWSNNDLILISGNGVPPSFESSLLAYWGTDSSQHVVFVGPDGHVHELYCAPGKPWANNDLTAMAGGVGPATGFAALPLPGWSGDSVAAASSALAGHWGTDSSQHVLFIGTDGHIHELYIHPGAGWVNNDLTAMSGNGVRPMPGSALASHWGSDNSQHVLFIGTDGHVHELYIHPGAGWSNNDLTAMSGNGVVPTPRSPLRSYWGSDASQHVCFIGTDGHVHELYIHPGAGWSNNDLTAMSGHGVGAAA